MISRRTAERLLKFSNGVTIAGAAIALLGSLADDATENRFWTITGAAVAFVGAIASASTARLRDKLSGPRALSEAQRTLIINLLRGHEFEVWTSFVGTDPEAILYRHDLDATLAAAGLKTHYYSGQKVGLGLAIVQDPGGLWKLLASAFHAAQVEFSLVPPETVLASFVKEGCACIMVGSRLP